MKIFQNYHKHSAYTNIRVPDSVISNEDYAKRIVEYGHKIISGVEHGNAGRYIEGYELAKKYDLKFLFGTEAYWVKNRLEKDDHNNHIILLAKNENGRQAINEILSEANLTGFYYQPRVDLSLLLSLPPKDVWVTTACIAFWKYEDSEEIVEQLYDHFANNFYLEVQYHNTERQANLNRRILDLSNRFHIPIIMGCDSHMLDDGQQEDRRNYLLSKKIEYPDEEHWFLDYPNGDMAYLRFVDQGVLTHAQIDWAIDNTNCFLDVEEYTGSCFQKNIKMPSLYSDKSQEEKDKIFQDLVWERWNDEKKNISIIDIPYYEEEIKKEIDIVLQTKHADYFLLNSKVVEVGKSLGGVITPSGRGSGVSFYINKLLGFTKVDRIAAKVQMYPERFMSVTRILESGTLADFDFNLANPDIFSQAQKQLLGENSSYPMIAYGTMKPKAAWKMYARAMNVDFETANTISAQIESYEMDAKHDEDGELNISDYITEEFRELYQESTKYQGIISDIKVHPCAHLIYQGNIRKEIGLIKTKSSNGKENICCVMDGLWAEQYKFMKNDLLTVAVVELIDRVYRRIGKPIDEVNDLIEKSVKNDKIWEVYKNAWTMGINQVERRGTNGRVAKYAPKNISELCAFIAAIRPGFQSMYKTFENRESFSYGIKSFDKLIQTDEMRDSFVLYQEQAMATLNYAGIPMSECYEIIKNIAKKRAEKVLKYRETFLDGFAEKLVVKERKTQDEARELALLVWQILEDSSRYSFNASHSYCVAVDSLYGAYLKSHHPLEFYETFLTILEENGEKDRLSEAKFEAEKAYKIKFPPYKFGQDNRTIKAISEKGEITSSLSSIKGFGSKIADDLWELSRSNKFENFLDFLIVAEEQGKLSKKFEDLIRINYFEGFGGNAKLMKIYQEFTTGESRYSRKHKESTKAKRIEELRLIYDSLPNNRLSIWEQIYAEMDILGYIQATYPVDKHLVYVLKLDERYSPRLDGYCLATGKIESLKVNKKYFENHIFGGGDILFCKNFEKKPAYKKTDTGYEIIDGQTAWWIKDYYVVPVDRFDEYVKKTDEKISI